MEDIRRYRAIVPISLGIHVALLVIMFTPAIFRIELPILPQVIAVVLALSAGIACGWIAKDLDLKPVEMTDYIIFYVIVIAIITIFAFFVANFVGEIVARTLEFDVDKIIKLIKDSAWSITKPEFISEMLAFIVAFYGYWSYLRMEEARKTLY